MDGECVFLCCCKGLSRRFFSFERVARLVMIGISECFALDLDWPLAFEWSLFSFLYTDFTLGGSFDLDTNGGLSYCDDVTTVGGPRLGTVGGFVCIFGIRLRLLTGGILAGIGEALLRFFSGLSSSAKYLRFLLSSCLDLGVFAVDNLFGAWIISGGMIDMSFF